MARKKNIVKSAKRSIFLIVLLIVALGWGLVTVGILNDDDRNVQLALQQQAEEFLKDKLYIRAVASYKEALTFKTDLNSQLEEELLRTYYDGNMMEEYYAMAEKRIGEGKASQEEYMDVIWKDVASASNKNALEVLKSAMKLWPEDQEMTEIYESLVYECELRAVDVTEVRLTSGTGYMPAFNGEKWGYLNSANGRLALSFQYDYASAFDGGYAVVKEDGQFVLIDANGYWNAVDKVGLDGVRDIHEKRIVGVKDGKCKIYRNTFVEFSPEEYEDVILNDNGMFFVKKNGKWALLDSSLNAVTDYIFTDVAMNSRGHAFYAEYAVVADERGYYMITQDGQACFEERFVNAKGIESGMVAVADQTGKWGFINQNAALVIDFQYDDALSFSSGLGAVKDSGKWFYINKNNRIVIQDNFVQVYPFSKERAMVVDELGIYKIVKLKYYDYL